MTGNWDTITPEELRRLSLEEGLPDSQVAQLYGVTKGQVLRRRRKWGINCLSYSAERAVESFKADDPKLFADLHAQAKKALLAPENLDEVAKALTVYLYRNGAIEDLHHQGKLSEDDMEMLNRQMADRLAGLLLYAEEGNWLQLQLLCGYYRGSAADWDPVKPEAEELKTRWERKKQRDLHRLCAELGTWE